MVTGREGEGLFVKNALCITPGDADRYGIDLRRAEAETYLRAALAGVPVPSIHLPNLPAAGKAVNLHERTDRRRAFTPRRVAKV